MINRKFLLFCCAAVLLFGASRLYHSLTDDFRIANIKEEMPYHPEWETTPLTSEEQQSLFRILDQRFTYLAKGAQSYAFASEDGKYVLKFFKFKHSRPNLFVRMLPSLPYLEHFKKRHIGKKMRKMLIPFSGYQLADHDLKKESGLVAVHLNQTNTLKRNVKVKDKIGFVRTIPLDDVVFIVQERAESTIDVLKRLLDQGELFTAKVRISQLKQLLRNEYCHQIADYDRDTLKNTGYVGERAIRMDLGMLHRDPGMIDPDQELHRIDRELKKWLDLNYPQYTKELLL